ncbi:MAG: ArsR family transcriptional regulator [bacterium]|nr:ArsR family transcriptional regulator [bacterium]
MGAAQTKSLGDGPGGRPPLDPLIHGRIRLLILSLLLRSARTRTFTGLRNDLGLTDGTLSAQLAKLEEGGMVKVTKAFAGKRPMTRVALTARGRRSFSRYLSDLKLLLPGLAD